jgi:hypothetical protein
MVRTVPTRGHRVMPKRLHRGNTATTSKESYDDKQA